jgi:hypothetical protein
MITATLGEVLRHPGKMLYPADNGVGCVFGLREGSLMFYISQGDPRRRLLEHLGAHGQWSSQIGNLVINNSPASLEWLVDMWSLEECRPFLLEDEILTPEAARFALIRYYLPCLNFANNPNAHPLPSKYRASLAHSPNGRHLLELLASDNEAGLKL